MAKTNVQLDGGTDFSGLILLAQKIRLKRLRNTLKSQLMVQEALSGQKGGGYE
jgi:hypothetical protein